MLRKHDTPHAHPGRHAACLTCHATDCTTRRKYSLRRLCTPDAGTLAWTGSRASPSSHSLHSRIAPQPEELGWRHAGGRNTCVRTQGYPIQYFRTDFSSCRHAAARRRAPQRGAGTRGAPRSQHAAALQVRRAHGLAHVLLQLGLHLAPLDRLGRGRARALLERLRGRRRGR